MDALSELGLSEAEIELYTQLIKSGETSASELAKRIDRNRSFVYDRLARLEEMGLVSYVKQGSRKSFRAAPPKQLLTILEEREERLRETVKTLESYKEHAPKEPLVEVFSSAKGVRTVLRRELEDTQEALISGSVKGFQNALPVFINTFANRAKERGVRARLLTSDGVELPGASTKLLSEQEQSLTTEFIFDKGVVTVTWTDVPVAVLIDSEEVAKNATMLFESIWERDVRIYAGSAGIQKAWMELLDGAKRLWGYGFSYQLAQIYGREFSNRWHVLRRKRNIPARFISYADESSRKYFGLRSMEQEDFHIRFLERELLGPACVVGSKERVVTFIYTEEQLQVIVSENKEMISAYEKHYRTLWKKSPSRASTPSPSPDGRD